MTTSTMDWLDANKGGGDSNPGVFFGTPGQTVKGIIAEPPRPVETKYGDRLVIDLKVTAVKDGICKGTEGADGAIEVGETVTVWAKPGAMSGAIRSAVEDADATGLTVGDTLTIKYVADGEKKPGKNPPKLYEARYEPAKPSTSLDDLI